MNTRFSSLAAVAFAVVTFALAGCAADADGTTDPGERSDSEIGQHDGDHLRVADRARIADGVDEAKDEELRREAAIDVKYGAGPRPELAPMPGFGTKRAVGSAHVPTLGR